MFASRSYAAATRSDGSAPSVPRSGPAVLPELPRSPLRRSLSILLAALCLLALVPAAARAGTLDQSQTDTDGSSATIGGTFSWAQTFTAGISGQLDQVDLLLRRIGDPGDLTVEVRTVSGGVPSSTVLASETVAQASVPTGGVPGWVSVALSPAAPSSAGTQYAIVLSAPTADPIPDNSYSWSAKSGDPYPAGQALFSTDGGATWGAQPADFAFKTYVVSNEPPDCSGVSASPGTLSPATRDQLKTITLSGASDPDGDTLSFHIDSVSQDEPVSGVGIGDDTSPDAQLVGGSADSNQVRVRAERNPKGNGRVYRIAYTVSDGNGGSCSGVAKVSVPRKKRQAAVDDGDSASWDSFTGAQLTPP
jgi:hypothetical protein